jgi:hypothetical protein
LNTGSLGRVVRCLFLTALVVFSPAPVRAAKDKPPAPPVPRHYLVRYLVFTISPAPGRNTWPEATPIILPKTLPPGLPTPGTASFSAIELPFRSQLASREQAQHDLQEFQRTDPLYRYDLLFWGQEDCMDGVERLTLDGPTSDQWQITMALVFTLHSTKPDTVDLRESGKIRLSTGVTGGWSSGEPNLRLGKTYTMNADGGVPLKQIMVACSIVPAPEGREHKPPAPIR